MSTLHKVLSNNKTLLGDQYQNLGKSTGSFLYKKRIFLAYNEKKNEFDVVTLNVIQIFLRNVFGFYKSTRLAVVANAWDGYKIDNEKLPKELDALDQKLHSAWKRKYPKAAFPTYAIFLATDSSQNPRIIAGADIHTDDILHKVFGRTINQHYKPGDLVIVEGVRAGIVTTKRQGATQHIKESVLLQGWEPEGFEKSTVFDKTIKEVVNPMEQTWVKLRAAVPKDDNFSDQDLIPLEQAIKEFSEAMGQAYAHNYSNAQERENQLSADREFLRKSYAKLKDKSFPQGEKATRGQMWLAIIAQGILLKVSDKTEKAKYDHVTKKGWKDAVKRGGIRNASLADQIENALKSGRRVMLTAGALHLINGGPKENMDRILALFQKYSTVLVTNRKFFQQHAFVNGHLREIPAI
jgi:hypothetical protein